MANILLTYFNVVWYAFFFLMCWIFRECFQLQKYEELVSNVNKEAYSCLQRGEGETGDVTRPPVYNVGHQEVQGRLRRRPPLQETGTDKGTGLVFNLANCISST